MERSPRSSSVLAEGPALRTLASAPAALGPVVYVDLLLAHVPLDRLLVLDHVLAHPYLLLNHGTLLDDDLFFDHRHKELVLADLGLRGLLALDRHPLDAHLLALLGHPHPLAVGATRLRTLISPASRSRVPTLSSSSARCTLSSSPPTRLLPRLRPVLPAVVSWRRS